MKRPKKCPQCGAPNYSYDARAPAWEMVVLRLYKLRTRRKIYLCTKCIYNYEGTTGKLKF